MTELSLADGLEALSRHTRATSIAIYLVIALGVVVFVGKGLETFGAIDMTAVDPDLFTILFAFAYTGRYLAFLASIVLVSMWLYRAHANLRLAGIEGEFSPGWAVGWYFIPIANLFKPFEAMRELWNASHMKPIGFDAEAPSDVKIWWVCFIVGNILTNISTRINGYTGDPTPSGGYAMGALGALVTIASAWHLLRIVRNVDRAQRDEFTAAAVFA
jgi:hypothetical protein